MVSILVLVVPGAIPSATATEIDQQQLSALAQRAQSDPAALEDLRRVTSVSGVPIDMDALLDAPPESVAARLNSMANLGDVDTIAPASELSETALSILARSEYEQVEGTRGESLQARLIELIVRYMP